MPQRVPIEFLSSSRRTRTPHGSFRRRGARCTGQRRRPIARFAMCRPRRCAPICRAAVCSPSVLTSRVADVAVEVVSVQLKGGAALQRHLKAIAAKLGKGAAVKVGFFEDEKYPGG